MASSDLQASPFRLPAPVATPAESRAGIGWRLQLLVFFIAAAAVVSRRPDALFNPQFFGEDGTVWYANAYTLGWFHSLFLSQNGYFQTLPRLAAALALLAPLHYAPLVMNLIGITFQVLPVNLLLSSRCSNWAPLSARAFMAMLYIALPNTMELNASVEEGQWHLALVACMLVLARRPEKKRLQIFDLAIILLSGVTGPFCILLLPIALVFWWLRREPFRLVVIGTLVLSICIQLSALLPTAAATRPKVGLGATPKLFLELLGGQVYLGALLGRGSLQRHDNAIVLAIVALLAAAILIYCLIKASLEMKMFLSFAVLVFAVSLASPMVSWTVPQWRVLREAGGIRYWFFPMLAFAWTLIWCVREGNQAIVRLVAAVGLLCMFIGIVRDWKYPAYSDHQFPKFARQFEAAAPGTMINIPIYPDGWVLRLTKKAPLCSSFPAGFIDQPPPNARLSGPVTVMGWVAGSQPVQQVTISADHIPMRSTQLSQARPEIDSLYPQSPDKQKGWVTVLDASRLSLGTHEIEARAHESNGCEADFYTLPLERVK